MHGLATDIGHKDTTVHKARRYRLEEQLEFNEEKGGKKPKSMWNAYS